MHSGGVSSGLPNAGYFFYSHIILATITFDGANLIVLEIQVIQESKFALYLRRNVQVFKACLSHHDQY